MRSVGPIKSSDKDDEDGNHLLTCSSVTGPNLVSMGRSNSDGAWRRVSKKSMKNVSKIKS